MVKANGFVVWAETIKQAPTERTQPAGFSQSVKWTSFDFQRPRIFRQMTRFDPVADYRRHKIFWRDNQKSRTFK